MKWTLRLLVPVLAFWAAPALATLGGPQTIDVLGFDPKNQIVYFTEEFHDESGNAPDLYAIRLTGKHVPSKVPFVEVQGGPDAYGRIKRLRSRLAPLMAEKACDLTLAISGVKARQFVLEDVKVPSWTVALKIRQGKLAATTKVRIYHRPAVRMDRCYRIPGGARLAILSYTGIPYEGGYEAQSAMLLARP